MATPVGLPPGFQLDPPAAATVPTGTGGLPPGFQLDPKDGDPVNGAVPKGFYGVTGDDGKQTLRRELGAGDVGNMLRDLPGVGAATDMAASAVNLGNKVVSGFAGMFGGAPAVEKVQSHNVQLPPSNDPVSQAMRAVSGAAEHVAKPVDDLVASLPPGPRTAIEGVEQAIPDIATVAAPMLPKVMGGGRAAAPRVIPGGDVDAALAEAGYQQLPRQNPNSSFGAKLGASATGEEPLASKQSLTNQAVTDQLAKGEAGITGDTPISFESLAQARNNGPGKVYAAAREAVPETLVQDQPLQGALASVGDTTSQLPRSPDVDALKQAMLSQPGMTRDQVFANVQAARERASRFYASEAPEAEAMGDAYSAVANAYEDFIGRQIAANPQSPISLGDFQNARVAFAKNYAAQSALRGASIDAGTYARLHRKNPDMLTGGSRLIAEQHNRYPLSTRFGPTTFAPDGIGAAGSVEGGIARNITGPAVGAGVGAFFGGPGGAAAGAAAGHLGSAVGQGVLRRILGSNAEAGTAAARAAPTSDALSNFFRPDSELPPPIVQPKGIAGLLPAPAHVNAGGGATTATTLAQDLGLTPDVQAAGKAHPGAARDSGLVEPEARPPMEAVPFREPENWSGLSLAPEGLPAKPGAPGGELSLADMLAGGVEQSPPPGLSLGEMMAPKQEGVPFRRDPGHMAGDLELAPENQWFNEQPLGDLAGVMSQGVPEGIASRSTPPRSAKAPGVPNKALTNNASGESAASVEAINRDKMERAAGQARYLIDPDGKMWPVRGVEAADAKAPKGSIIVQKGVGDKPFTILDRGNLPTRNAQGLLNRALAGGEGLTLGDLLGGG